MYLNDLKIGMELTTDSVTVEKADMLAFAHKYNPAPIHTDEVYAAGTKFGKPIAAGMYSFLLIWAKYIEQDFFGQELIAGKSTKVEWEKPVFAGDELTGHCMITNITILNEKRGIAELSLDITNQNDELVLRSVTEAVVRCRCKISEKA